MTDLGSGVWVTDLSSTALSVRSWDGNVDLGGGDYGDFVAMDPSIDGTPFATLVSDWSDATIIWAGPQAGWGGDGHIKVSTDRLTLNTAAVPEPMSIMLGIMGLGSIAGFRKLRRK